MFLPKLYPIKAYKQETKDTFTLALEVEKRAPFSPGQFNMLYLFGFGEVPISISGDPENYEELTHTIRSVGAITSAMQKLKVGDFIGVRGPFGTSWPLEKRGMDVLVIAGGLGIAAMRSLLFHLSAHQKEVGTITLLYGARTPEDILYQEELKRFQRLGIIVDISVDRADLSWQGHVGVITSYIHKRIKNPQNTRVFLCGPEIMIKFSIHELLRSPIKEEEIFISMERNMECAQGFCGHCQYGPYFLCKDGPIFSYKNLKAWLPIKEL